MAVKGGFFSQPAHQVPEIKKIVLGPEAVEKSVARLTAPRHPPKAGDDHFLAPSKVIPNDQVAALSSRLHDMELEKKKQKEIKRIEKERKEEMALRRTKLLPASEINERTTRLYMQHVEAKEAATARLKKKYLFRPPTVPPVSLVSISRRQYYEVLQKRKESRDKLFAKYVYGTLPQVKKLSPEQIVECGERLSSARGMSR